jgi:hypothetical protein
MIPGVSLILQRGTAVQDNTSNISNVRFISYSGLNLILIYHKNVPA